MTNYSEYKELKSNQNTIVDMLSDKLNSFPKSSFGLISDEVRATDEFKNTNVQYNREFKKLQNINQTGVKLFKKEIRKDYENRYKKG